MRRLCSAAATAAIGLLVLPIHVALSEPGPAMESLRVTKLYTSGSSSGIYVEFNAGSMPGCYKNKGGRLYPENPYYDQLYAQLLTLVSMGGVRGRVVFTINAQTGNWGDCTINGMDLRPA